MLRKVGTALCHMGGRGWMELPLSLPLMTCASSWEAEPITAQFWSLPSRVPRPTWKMEGSIPRFHGRKIPRLSIRSPNCVRMQLLICQHDCGHSTLAPCASVSPSIKWKHQDQACILWISRLNYRSLLYWQLTPSLSSR